MPDLLTSTAAGTLDKRVALLRPVRATADTGERLPTVWVVAAFVWAEILPTTGREPIAARRLIGEITHQVKVRGRMTEQGQDWPPREDWRVRYQGRVFEVDHVLELAEQGAVLSLRCVERRPDQGADA